MVSEADVVQHSPKILSLAIKLTKNKEDGEDLTQQVLVKAIKKISLFQERSKLWTWLYRITVNQHLNNLRKVKALESTDTEEFVSPVINEEDKLLAKIILEKELSRLDKDDRDIFTLKYLKGYTIEEISTEVMQSTSTVSRSLAETTEKIRSKLID